jgi:hypothetical protein
MRISSPPIGGLTTSGGAEPAIAPGSALIEFPPAGFTPTTPLDLMTVNDQKIGTAGLMLVELAHHVDS